MIRAGAAKGVSRVITGLLFCGTMAWPPSAIAQTSIVPGSGLHFGFTFGATSAASISMDAVSGFYRGAVEPNTSMYAGLFAEMNVARLGSSLLTAGPTVDVTARSEIAYRGLAGGAPVVSNGQQGQTNVLAAFRLTTPMANGLDLSAFVAPGVAILRPTGRPTGAGGPEILGSDLTPALRLGLGVSRRAGRNLSVGLEVAYQYTARSEFDTSLPGERFERGGSNELRGGLRSLFIPTSPQVIGRFRSTIP
jgi:hypothetical protein